MSELEQDYATTRLLTNREPIIINNREDKFETVLFLPEGEGRIGEGGLRTKGYFKHSYVKCKMEGAKDEVWCIADMDDNPLMPAPVEIQQKIEEYLNSNTENSQFKVSHFTKLPLVTVITVVLNGEKYLEQTIQSVINQTYPNVEYIIIDGGSTDGTLSIIKKYEDKIDYWVSERDKGIYDAFNKGIIVSTGHIIGIINSDDWYELNAIETMVYKRLSTKAEIIHGILQYHDEGSKKRELFFANDALLYKDMTVNHPTVFVSRDCYQNIGLFRHDFHIAMDYELLLRAKVSGVSFLFVEECIANMRLGGKSDKGWLKARLEVAKAKSLHLSGTFNHYLYFAYQLIKGMSRIILERLGLHFIVKFYLENFSLVKRQGVRNGKF